MKIYRRIDEDGYFVEDVVVEPVVHDPVYDNETGELVTDKYEEYPDMDEYHISDDVPDGIFKPRWVGDKWVDAEDEATATARKKRVLLEAANNQIRETIYTHYPREKQEEDKGWKIYWESYIVGIGGNSDTINSITMDQLVSDVVKATVDITNGTTTISDYISSKPEYFMDGYKKLIKISIRFAWLKEMIDEWKTALQEDRTPNYPDYPFMEGK